MLSSFALQRYEHVSWRQQNTVSPIVVAVWRQSRQEQNTKVFLFHTIKGAFAMLNFLIVDDSKYQRYIIELCLKEFGHCDQAEDGRQALKLFADALQAERPYDLVVLDILMPEMDGHAALKRINALQADREPRSKVVMLSSLDDPQNMMQAQFEEGADAYITKPFEDETLIEVLRSLELIENPLESDIEDLEP